MSYLKVTHYIGVLLKEGRRWEFTDLLDQKNEKAKINIKKYAWIKRLILSVPSFLIFLFLKNGINQESVGYGIAALSIFIGLFSSLIITMYGRFLNMPELPADATDQHRIEDKKVKNFIRQYTFITGKNLFIATFMIALMLLILIFPNYMAINIFTITAIDSIVDLTESSFMLGLNALIAVSLRMIIIYLTFDFFLSLCYSLGALFSFLKREYS